MRTDGSAAASSMAMPVRRWCPLGSVTTMPSVRTRALGRRPPGQPVGHQTRCNPSGNYRATTGKLMCPLSRSSRSPESARSRLETISQACYRMHSPRRGGARGQTMSSSSPRSSSRRPRGGLSYSHGAAGVRGAAPRCGRAKGSAPRRVGAIGIDRGAARRSDRADRPPPAEAGDGECRGRPRQRRPGRGKAHPPSSC